MTDDRKVIVGLCLCYFVAPIPLVLYMLEWTPVLPSFTISMLLCALGIHLVAGEPS